MRNTKKLCGIFLVVCILSALFPMSLSAEGDIAEIDGTGYPSLQAAVDAAPDSEETTISLIGAETAATTISAGKILY